MQITQSEKKNSMEWRDRGALVDRSKLLCVCEYYLNTAMRAYILSQPFVVPAITTTNRMV